VALIGVALVASSCAVPSNETLVLAAGTTLVDSGFLDALVEAYEAEFPERTVSVVGRSTAEVLALGGAGSADILITHDPLQEEAFIAGGLSRRDETVFESEFLLVAPPAIARLMGGSSLDEALLRLVDRTVDVEFVSRGDLSGTHQRELGIWANIGGVPHEAAWYLETGQGMGATLQVASQKSAATFSERGAFLATAGLDLQEVNLLDVPLANPYRAIVPVGVSDEAEHFLDWLLVNEALVKRVNDQLFGTQVYRTP
jgi:tungstate transport system substrate-binding protein